MKDRFYVRLTDDEQVAAFVKEFVRTGLIKVKRELIENQGKSLKEIMIEKDRWDSFVYSTTKWGKNPEVDVKELEKKARSVSED